MTKALRLDIRGTVQGVGFRPWVYRLARGLSLNGFISNTAFGVTITIEGSATSLAFFCEALRAPDLAHCVITESVCVDIPLQGLCPFHIRNTTADSISEALVLPDMATCPLCLKEIFDPKDRRYLYPFTNCTHCGPRYSIIESLPYDRGRTSMRHFTLCALCQAEYIDPSNRRFHAQPNACPDCGPRVSLWDDQGIVVASAHEAVPVAARLIQEGYIVALKGIGGFYLLADACDDKAVALLRQRKARPHKPFALMMSSVEMARQYCRFDDLACELLESPQAPIVLLPKREGGFQVSRQVAVDNPYLGCMLPMMPLTHILMRRLNRPLVATSGNISQEPLCIDNHEAVARLAGIADFFLVHDRPIVRPVDDSIVHLICGQGSLLRRARGFAPLPMAMEDDCTGILAVGAHQKNAIALGLGRSAIISQHLGDLESPIACQTFEDTIKSLRTIYDAPLTEVVCDAHPDYASSVWARRLGIPLRQVGHHHAHIAACMAERSIQRKVLGVCWDGTGYGQDGTIWGGEFLVTDGVAVSRHAHLKTFALAGADKAIEEPRRSALGLLFESCQGDWHLFKDLPLFKTLKAGELDTFSRMMRQKINSPLTSSMGRLFDGIASLLDLCQCSSFEGQAAMALEFQVSDQYLSNPYPYTIARAKDDSNLAVIDWTGIVQGIVKDMREGRPSHFMATRFHWTLIDIIATVAHCVKIPDIVLTGGCFQNKWLLENAVYRLKQEGFHPHWPSQVPAHDGGIALGQMCIAARSRLKEMGRCV